MDGQSSPSLSGLSTDSVLIAEFDWGTEGGAESNKFLPLQRFLTADSSVMCFLCTLFPCRLELPSCFFPGIAVEFGMYVGVGMD